MQKLSFPLFHHQSKVVFDHDLTINTLDKAKATHLISPNPCEGVTLPKLDTDETRAMTKDEMDRFLIQLQDPNLATVGGHPSSWHWAQDYAKEKYSL